MVSDRKITRALLQDLSWLSPPTDLALSGNQVHVWRASLDQPAWRLRELAQTLSADEQARAGRFRFEQDRRRFTASHGILRAILGRYLGVKPEQLRFQAGPHGKPSLAKTLNESGLSFNMSHSHILAVFAVTRDREVGVDVERIRLIPDAEQIAERFFSSQESAVFQTIPADLKPEAFFTCWVRKEAYVKAKGNGLSLSLDQFDVSLIPGEPARLLRTTPDPQEANHWSLHDVSPGPGYLATVAVQGNGWRLKCWEWT
jgi:4'-phosphopantetheinyl transferase